MSKVTKRLQSHFIRATFPAPLANYRELDRNFDWFIALLAPVVIGRSDYFGIGFSMVTIFKTALTFGQRCLLGDYCLLLPGYVVGAKHATNGPVEAPLK